MRINIRHFMSTWAHAVAVLLICALLLTSLSAILTPKFLYYLESTSPEQETFSGFYALSEDSLDVVFTGSSHIYNGVNPVVFYQETGWTSYDLAFSSMDFGSTYYVLEEMYRFQSPEYVVLDCNYLTSTVFKDNGVYKRITEYMKWSKIKYEYIQEWLARDTDRTLIERAFPLYAYHQRWSELTFTDFRYEDYIYSVKGYIPSGKSTAYSRDHYYDEYDFKGIPEETYEYLWKIAALCQENGSTLILVCLPYQSAREAITEGLQAIADETGVVYLDYNEETLFNSIGLDLNQDFLNSGHLNTYGATKMTQTIAAWFLENAVIETPCAENQEIRIQWDEDVVQWERDRSMYLLLNCGDIDTYLSLLEDDRYLIFMATSAFTSDGLSAEQRQQLQLLGCTCSFDQDNGAYLGIYRSGAALVQGDNAGDDTFEGEVNGISYYIYTDATTSNIVIDGIEYCVNSRGLNFVVYDTVTERVIDAVCFDTDDDMKASRSS